MTEEELEKTKNAVFQNFLNPFSLYKDIHKGQSAIFFGSGPTLLDFDTDRIPDDMLRFGLNDQIFLDLNLDYWFMGDSMPQVPSKFYDRAQEYNDYRPKKQKFVRICTWDLDMFIDLEAHGRVARNGQLPPIDGAKYYVADSGGNPNICLFNEELSIGRLKAVSSISFEVLQFILYTGVKKIYLVGHDCDYSEGTFAKIMIGKSQRADHYILRYWKVVKRWLDEHHPDVEIYTINPVALDAFPIAKQINENK
jgi:hypothetical protein|tara:strand:- start:6842 stop:7597 length:756 start_codon:yes stop_codon:yes gene_type:complete